MVYSNVGLALERDTGSLRPTLALLQHPVSKAKNIEERLNIKCHIHTDLPVSSGFFPQYSRSLWQEVANSRAARVRIRASRSFSKHKKWELRTVLSLPNIEEEEEKIVLPQAHVLKGWSSTGGVVCSRNFRRKSHIEDILLSHYLVLTLSCV